MPSQSGFKVASEMERLRHKVQPVSHTLFETQCEHTSKFIRLWSTLQFSLARRMSQLQSSMCFLMLFIHFLSFSQSFCLLIASSFFEIPTIKAKYIPRSKDTYKLSDYTIVAFHNQCHVLPSLKGNIRSFLPEGYH